MKLYPIQHNLCTHVHILYMHIFTYILNTQYITTLILIWQSDSGFPSLVTQKQNEIWSVHICVEWSERAANWY